jgi:hypothetical protein
MYSRMALTTQHLKFFGSLIAEVAVTVRVVNIQLPSAMTTDAPIARAPN